VLDVGCGVGRMAAQLTRYMAPGSRYDGFDIVAEGIDWCAANITPRFPNFHFQHADIFNTQYNPRGKYQAHEYRFPYPDGHFSFVFLTSVATHVLSADMQNYLHEIRRVLIPGGRCFITYFLINGDSQRQIDAGKSSLPFRFRIPHGRVQNPDTPEAAVAFEESAIRSWYSESGLSVVEPIHYGSWSGRPTGVGYQDIILATRD
jgi:SAM-dependent methyltransferase